MDREWGCSPHLILLINGVSVMSRKKTIRNVEAVINKVSEQITESDSLSGEKIKFLSGLINAYRRLLQVDNKPPAPQGTFYDTLECDASLYDQYGVLKDTTIQED